MMKIEKFVLGPVQTNSYLLINEDTKEAVIVDPATCPDYVLSHVKSNGYIPKGIILTHGHFDHVMGVEGWVEAYDIPIYLHEDEKEVLANPNLNLSTMIGKYYAYDKVQTLKDGDVLELAGFSFGVIHTPGHTKGGCCYYEEKEGVLMSGDTLFKASVGRSDFPTGSMATLVKSIKEKLFVLPDDIMVYPGHNSLTCIADEKIYNPFLK